MLICFLLQKFQSSLQELQEQNGLHRKIKSEKIFGNIKELLLCNITFFLKIKRVLETSQENSGALLDPSLLREAFDQVG